MKQTQYIGCLFGTVLLGLCALNASAADAKGKITVELGMTRIDPQNKSGNLTSPSFVNTKVKSESDSTVSGSITYFFNEHYALSVPVAFPFEHDMVGDDAIGGVGKIGSVKALPITTFAQYHFTTGSRITPYVGLGLTYAYFYDTKGTAVLSALTAGDPTTFKVDSKFALTPQVGLKLGFNNDWYANAMFAKTFLETTAELSTGQTIDVELNPHTLAFQIGRTF